MKGRRFSITKTWAQRLAPVRNYLRESNVHGYKNLAESNRIHLERFIWFVVIIGFMMGAVYATSKSLIDFYRAPTVISELPVRRSVKDINFPAVAICSATRFSKRKLQNLTDFVFSIQNVTGTIVGETKEEVYEVLRKVAHMGDVTQPLDEAQLMKLHLHLYEYFQGPYPIETYMRTLSPTCDEILESCSWQEKLINCTKYFRPRVTYYGICCVFNYIRPTLMEYNYYASIGEQPILNSTLRANTTQRIRFRGISAIIRFNDSDNAVASGYTTSTRVIVNNNYDYMDDYSGSLRETLVAPGTQSFITISPKRVTANPEVQSIPVHLRRCVFSNELELANKRLYTYGDCLLICRLEDVIRMCGCTPPATLPILNATYCDLADLPCLIRWKEKWSNTEGVEDTMDRSNAHHLCSNCYPTCNYARYEITSTYNKLRDGASAKPLFDNIIERNKHSVIHVYYGTDECIEYEQAMVSTWYELMSNFGGILSIVIGGSIISFIEIIYHLTGRFGAVYLKRFWAMTTRTTTAVFQLTAGKRNKPAAAAAVQQPSILSQNPEVPGVLTVQPRLLLMNESTVRKPTTVGGRNGAAGSTLIRRLSNSLKRDGLVMMTDSQATDERKFSFLN